MILALLLGCASGPGHDKTMFEACSTMLQVNCDCGLTEYCGADPAVQCEVYDERYCDVESGMFDADLCEDVSYYTSFPEGVDWYNCVNGVYAEACDREEVTAECGLAPWYEG